MSRKINRKQDVSIVIKGRTRTEKIVFPIVLYFFDICPVFGLSVYMALS